MTGADEGGKWRGMSETQQQLLMSLPPRSADSILKDRANMAFRAYEQAVKDGDVELADAARQRFLQASSFLAGKRECSPSRADEPAVGGAG